MRIILIIFLINRRLFYHFYPFYHSLLCCKSWLFQLGFTLMKISLRTIILHIILIGFFLKHFRSNKKSIDCDLRKECWYWFNFYCREPWLLFACFHFYLVKESLAFVRESELWLEGYFRLFKFWGLLLLIKFNNWRGLECKESFFGIREWLTWRFWYIRIWRIISISQCLSLWY